MVRTSVASKLVVLCIIPVLGIIPAWYGIQRSFRSSAEAERHVTNALRALKLANDVGSLAEQAILEERGFVLTGAEDFVEHYYVAIARFDNRAADLEVILQGQDKQVELTRELVAVVHEWREKVANPAIAAERRNEQGTGASLIATNGRRLSGQIRSLASQLSSAQNLVVYERLAESARARTAAERRAVTWVWAALGVAVIAGLAFALQIRRKLSQLTQTAEALAGGDLDRRLTISTADEIGRLGKSFNAMADRLRERTRDAAGLRKLSELVQACGSVEEAFEVTEQVVPSFFPGSRGVIHILNSSRTLLEVYGLFGEGAKELIKPEPASPEDCWAFRRGAPYRVEKGAHVPVCRHMASNAESFCCLPLTAHGENLGVLTLSPVPEGERIAVAELLAEQVGMAVGNLRLRDSLRTQAVRDALTGLFNRRYFEEVAEREIARARRHQRSVAFFMVDVDHFKRFNDNFGHDAGDFLLREVGQLLKTGIRQSDVACRYGGEEFVLILPESTAEDSRGRAEHLRQAFHRLQLTHQGRALARVTVSIGIAAFPSHGEDRHAVLRAADAGLYRAKDQGRDRVVVAPESAGATQAPVDGSEHADA